MTNTDTSTVPKPSAEQLLRELTPQEWEALIKDIQCIHLMELVRLHTARRVVQSDYGMPALQAVDAQYQELLRAIAPRYQLITALAVASHPAA